LVGISSFIQYLADSSSMLIENRVTEDEAAALGIIGLLSLDMDHGPSPPLGSDNHLI